MKTKVNMRSECSPDCCDANRAILHWVTDQLAYWVSRNIFIFLENETFLTMTQKYAVLAVPRTVLEKHAELMPCLQRHGPMVTVAVCKKNYATATGNC